MHLLNKKVVLMAVVFFMAIFTSVGCAKKESMQFGESYIYLLMESKLDNNVKGYYGASVYRTVNKEWLAKSFWPEWKSELHLLGITGWNGKYQCNAFASSFVSDLSKRYFIDSFHSFDQSESLAVGVIWYYIGGDKTKYHATVCFFDKNMDLWGLEVQDGTVFKFSDVEIKSITLELFQ